MVEMVPIRQNFTMDANLASDAQLLKASKIGFKKQMQDSNDEYYSSPPKKGGPDQ